MIDGLGLAGFFILHRELLELAREVAVQVRGPDSARALLPPGRGRGSSVSSIVCYLTGLSHIDPVANDLFLGRFLNEELTALPDIDLDFPRDIREVLIPRIHDRYGRERSALVAAFPTFRSRGAIRELGKVLGLPAGELERVARGAEPWAVRGVTADVESALGLEPGGPPAPVYDPDSRVAPFAMSTAEWQAMVNGRRPDREDQRPSDEHRRAALPGRWAWLARLCDEAYGLPRHLSQHSGGMIVSTRPLIDCCPVLPAAMEGRQLCQWDKDSCADAGFLKIDLLGLGMLSCVERAVELIARTRDERVDLSRIPFDDTATYEAIQTADTMGVFQIESRAQMQSLYRTRPETLDDLTIQVAIVRPGPILGGAVNPYIARRQRMREDPDYLVPYEHPSLEPVLRDTLGTIIFQDQVIEVAMAFAGFSPGEAEGLRRAMSRKRSEAAIEAFHQRFVEGAARTHGADAETAERVYTMIVGFSGFGFPKAHGAAFGLLAYQSTWLRVHYGPEFLCALLNEQPMGFYAPDTLAHEAQRKGIELIAPDVNLSGEECTVDDDGRIRLGLNYVLGARSAELSALVRAREQGGPFRSLADLASRAGAGRAILDRLAWAGACDALAGGGEGGRGAAVRRSPRAAPRTALWRLGVAAPRRGAQGRNSARAAARPSRRAGARGAVVMGRDGRRLRDDRPHARPASGRAAAARPAGGRRLDARPRDAPPRDAGDDGRARRRPPAAGYRQGDRLHPARGRVRHHQPDRAAAGLRAPPADRALRAAAAGARPAGEAADRRRRDQRLRARAACARRARQRRRRGRAAARARRSGRGCRLAGVGAGEPAPSPPAAFADFRGVAPAVQSFAAGRRRCTDAPRKRIRSAPDGRTRSRPAVRPARARRLFVAMSRRPQGRAAADADPVAPRPARRDAAVRDTVVVLGIPCPAAVIATEKSRNSIPEANVKELTELQEHGRELFDLRCKNCHALAAAKATARVGPNLDELQPPKALVLDAIENGRADGNGNMAAQLVEGEDAEAVAQFVAVAVGQDPNDPPPPAAGGEAEGDGETTSGPGE